MNKRKSFQTQKNITNNKNMNYCNKREFYQQCSNKKLKKICITNVNYLNNKAGITLIALVISIIVMLILAGVSLNATIGDNGIITQAQNATYMQSIATLEEYLQTEYVKYYDETENYTSKQELLGDKISNLFQRNGVNKYFTISEEDKLINHYLINKEALPTEIKNQIKGGDTTEYEKCIRLEDVYGVTPDLKVYYCSKGRESLIGTATNLEVNPKTPLAKANQDPEMKELLSDKLSEMGFNIGDNDITIENVIGLKEIEIDGSKYEISSISALAEIPNLRKITLKNLSIKSLDGIESLIKLNYLYLKNCQIEDYSKLSFASELQTLYIHLPKTMSEDIANSQITNLGKGLSNANSLNKLTTLGISGVADYFENSSLDIPAFTNMNGISNLSDVSGLQDISTTIKNSVTRLYLTHTSISNIKSLSDYMKINRLDIEANVNLKNLEGLENHSSLNTLYFHHCSQLENLENLTGCTGIRTIFGHSCQNLKSLTGLNNAEKIDYIYMVDCNLTDLKALENKTTLKQLWIANNVNLESVSVLGTLTGLTNLSLLNNEKMIATELRDALANPETHIAKNCGGSFYVPQKYLKYFTDTSTTFDFSNFGLTDDSEELNSLKYKTSVKKLKLDGNNQISNAKLQEILSTMTGLQALSLNGCTNLKSIDFINENKVTKLRELDLRGTSTELTDLSNLNNYAKSLNFLLLDNPATEMSKIIPTIKLLSARTWGYGGDDWLYGSHDTWKTYGMNLDGDMSKFSFENCYGITYFMIDTFDTATGILDLSGLVDAYTIKNSYINVKYPAYVKNISTRTNWASDFSLVTDLENLYINVDGKSDDSIKTFVNKFENVLIRNLEISQNGLANLNTLGNLKVTTLTITGQVTSNQKAKITDLRNFKNAESVKALTLTGSANLKNLAGIESFTGLMSLTIQNCPNLIDITGIGKCTNLQELTIQSCKVGDITEIGNLANLAKLYLGSNNFVNISALGSLKNIKELDLHSNSIVDLGPLENMIVNSKIGFTTLNLSDNLISNISVSGHDNISTLKLLKKAGLQNLDISNTEINDSGKEELKKVYKDLKY